MVATAMNQMSGGEAALIVSGAGQAGVADHVAHRIDVRQGGAVVVVHLDLAAVVRGDAQVLQTHVLGVAGAAVGP